MPKTNDRPKMLTKLPREKNLRLKVLQIVNKPSREVQMKSFAGFRR